MQRNGKTRAVVIAAIVFALSLLGGFERTAGWISGSTPGDITGALRTLEQWHSAIPILGNTDFQNTCAISALIGVVFGFLMLTYYATTAVILRFRHEAPPSVPAIDPPARNLPEKRAAQAAWKKRIDDLNATLDERVKDKKYRLGWYEYAQDSLRDFLSPAVAAEAIKEFQERTKGIDSRGQVGVDAALRGALYLGAKRDTIRDSQLR